MLVLLDNFSSINFPFPANTFVHYARMCDSSELKVVLDLELHRHIRAVLTYDKRKGNAAKFGRVLMQDVLVPGGVQLLTGDRLEPSFELMDVGDTFDSLTIFPKTVVFWRIRRNAITHHRNPLFDKGLGVTPERVLGIDGLHTLALGTFLILLHVRHRHRAQT